jgi:hypothetical protein
MLKRLRVLAIALVAMFAVGVLVASAAYAEEGEWLAGSNAEWLANGSSITGVGLVASTTGLLELTDLKAPGGSVTADCEGSFDGTLGTEGIGEIVEALYLGKKETESLLECEIVKSKEGLCETSMLADVIPIGLPWVTQLSEEAGKFVEKIIPVDGALGYMVVCLTILGETLDECTVSEGRSEAHNLTDDVETVVEEEGTGNCSLGGSGGGDISGSLVVALGDGESLQAAKGGGSGEQVGNKYNFKMIKLETPRGALIEVVSTGEWELLSSLIVAENGGEFKITNDKCKELAAKNVVLKKKEDCAFQMIFEPLRDPKSTALYELLFLNITTNVEGKFEIEFEGEGA